MKKVLSKTDETRTIFISDLRDESFVGLLYPDNKNSKYIAMKTKQGFCHMGYDLNITDCYHRPSMQYLVKEAQDLGAEVFEFPTFTDLMQWFAK